MKVGLLALQGAIEPHERAFASVGVETKRVLRVEDLQGIAGIVYPGGESTTMILLAKRVGLWDKLREFSQVHPSWGICAGAILLAKKVSHPAQDSLGILDIHIERNAFGRQLDSFAGPIDVDPSWADAIPRLEGVFIRAPRIREVGPGVQTRVRWEGESVFVEQGNSWASTFHPELTDNPILHSQFAKRCAARL